MSTYLVEADRITLSSLDIRLLVALLKGRNVGYDLARQCELDMGDNHPVHTRNAYRALAKLETMMLVSSSEVGNARDARQKRLYKITSLGRNFLHDELVSYQGLIILANERQVNK